MSEPCAVTGAIDAVGMLESSAVVGAAEQAATRRRARASAMRIMDMIVVGKPRMAFGLGIRCNEENWSSWRPDLVLDD